MNAVAHAAAFPFLFGGAFIEAVSCTVRTVRVAHFPSFLEGLSLRQEDARRDERVARLFPFLLGRAFIEAHSTPGRLTLASSYPTLFGGTFIEAGVWKRDRLTPLAISLPFRRDIQ